MELDPTTVYSLSFGVEGMEPLSGTLDELKAILDGYNAHFVQKIFFAEAAVGNPVWQALKPYVAKRFVDHFCAENDL